MAEEKKEELSNLTLPQVIQRKLKSKLYFEELENFDKGVIIQYIHENEIDIKIFKKIGYDIIKKCFFGVEYVYRDDIPRHYDIERKNFENFEVFFEYVKGNIYDSACYYGYEFTNDEIKKYDIDFTRLNSDAFIDYDINQYTFESVLEERKENNQENVDKGKKIKKWISKIGCIDSYDTLVRKYKYFESRFNSFGEGSIFFSLIIQKFGDSIKDYIIEFRRKNDSYKGLDVEDIAFYYGVDSAEKVLIDFDGGCCTTSTRNKHKKKIRDKLQLLRDGNFVVQKRGSFYESYQLYEVKYLYFEEERFASLRVERYFISFDDFIKELNGDLSNVDLENAPVDASEILKYKTNENTKLPRPNIYSLYNVRKYYKDDVFCVVQDWFDDEENLILSHKEEFKLFCDFAHYLNNDLSEADLIMCDGIENISGINDLKLEGLRVRSDVAKKLCLVLETIPSDKYEIVEFEKTQKYELATINELMVQRGNDDDYSGLVSYVTDVHMLHRFVAWKCESFDDMDYVTKIVTKEIGEDDSPIKLIGGDIASDFEIYEAFIKNLKLSNSRGRIFLTLGNHELWPFKESSLYSIVDKYKEVINTNKMYLVHNNIFYLDCVWKEITTQELEDINGDDLRKKIRGASLIIFGGLGFSGKNDEFNANFGIYRDTLTREQEIEESNRFESLYLKVVNYLYDKNVIIFTHMPMEDWTFNDCTKGFVYVSGHSHRNYFFDDGIKRIYSDNQIGYKGKNVKMKHLSVSMDYDWFSDYKDGIYEITKTDYENFYRGIGEGLTFNRQFDKLYMLKREGTYMFTMTSPKGTMQILNGGAIKNAGGHTLEYFYQNLVPYSKSIKMFLSQFDELQQNVSKEIKSIGGNGRIHGSIVDIDFYNHLYLNPLDGTITPYFAYSMVDKYIYKNLPSLLKYECPNIYANYEKKLLNVKNDNALIVTSINLPVTKSRTYVDSTEMYRVSRILKGLQFTTKYNIVRLWNDTIAGEASEENGRLIVSGIINPEEMESIHREQKLIAHAPKKTSKPKEEKTALSEEELTRKRFEEYKEKIAKFTQTIEILEYNGSRLNSKYHCKLCGNTWEQRSDHFKGRGALHYVCPKCKR